MFLIERRSFPTTDAYNLSRNNEDGGQCDGTVASDARPEGSDIVIHSTPTTYMYNLLPQLLHAAADVCNALPETRDIVTICRRQETGEKRNLLRRGAGCTCKAVADFTTLFLDQLLSPESFDAHYFAYFAT